MHLIDAWNFKDDIQKLNFKFIEIIVLFKSLLQFTMLSQCILLGKSWEAILCCDFVEHTLGCFDLDGWIVHEYRTQYKLKLNISSLYLIKALS